MKKIKQLEKIEKRIKKLEEDNKKIIKAMSVVVYYNIFNK